MSSSRNPSSNGTRKYTGLATTCSSKKYRTTFSCPGVGCSFKFTTREKLIQHMLYNDSSSNCKSKLVECPHCSKYWATQESLSVHLRMDKDCRRLDNLPLTISTVKELCHPCKKPRTLEQERSMSVKDKKEHIVQEGVSLFKMPIKESRFIPGNDISSFNDTTTSVQKHDTNFKNFVLQCNNPNMMLHIDVYDALQREPTIPSNHQLTANILLRVSLCVNTQIHIRCPITNLIAQFRDENASLTLNGDLPFLPGGSEVARDLRDHDLLSFLFNHCTLETMCTDEHQHNDFDSMPNQGSQSHGNGSLVYDLFIDGNLVAQNDTDFGVEQNNETSSVLETSVDDVFSDDNNDIEIIDGTMLQLQNHVLNARSTMILDSSLKTQIDLYNILKKASTPKYLFDEIYNWVHKHQNVLSQMNHNESRSRFISQMGKTVYGNFFSKASQPLQTKLKLPSSRAIEVTTFSLRTSIVSILMDRNLMKAENLLIHPEDPFATPIDHNQLGDVNTGWWYRETVTELCTSDNNLLLPIILFIDGTTIDKMGKMQVEPVTFTLGILNREMRKLACAWRTLGYVEDLKNIVRESVKQNSVNINTRTKLQDYHAILDHILKDFQHMQGKSGGFKWKLDLNGNQFDVVFKIAVQVVIGDCKGNDALCGRYGSHGINVKGLCRDCLVHTHDGDDPTHKCVFIKRENIQHVSKEELEKISFHKIKNAFDEIYMGARESGITECTPPEPLHGFKLGLCKYLYIEFKSAIAPRTLRLMNATIQHIVVNNSFQSLKNLPSLTAFRNGIDCCNSLTAKESYARVFAMYLALMDEELFQSLVTCDRHIRLHDPITDKISFPNTGPMGIREAKKWFFLIEDTVLYDGWLMKPFHSRESLTPLMTDPSLDSPALTRIRKYLTDFKETVNRIQGNGLKIPKFHQNLHYVKQILKEGSLLNIDGNRPESFNKDNVKSPAKLTQKRMTTITKQIAKNYHENLLVQEGLREFDFLYESEEAVDEPMHGNVCCGSKFVFQFICDDYHNSEQWRVRVTWLGTSVVESMCDELVLRVAKRLFLHTGEGGCLSARGELHGFTEFRKDGITYRSHPSFRRGKAWNDWAMVAWSEEDDPIPAKIIMFLDLTNCEIMSSEEHKEFCIDILGEDYDPTGVDHEYVYLTNEKWMVVETALINEELPENFDDESIYRMCTIISTRYYLESGIRLLPVNSIVGPAYCIEIPSTTTVDGSRFNGKSEIITLKHKETWGDLFLSGL